MENFLLNQVIKCANEGICILDENLEIKEINENFLSPLGYFKKEVKDRKIFFMLTNDSLERIRKIKDCEIYPDDIIHKLSFINKKGKQIDLNVRFNKIAKKKEISKKYIVIYLKKSFQSQNDLLESQNLYKIFNKLDAAVYLVDPDSYEILFMNEKLRQLLGNAEIHGKCYEIFHNRNTPCEFCANQKLFQEGKSSLIWEKYNEKLGKWFKCMDQTISLSDEKKLRLEIAFDITEQKYIQESLKKAKLKLEKKNKELNAINKRKSNILIRVSHELKTPIIPIKGYADLILEEFSQHLNGEVLTYVKNIKKGTDKLISRINCITDSFHLGRDKKTYDFQENNLRHTVKSCINDLKSNFKQRDITIQHDLHKNLTCFYDVEKIKKVIMNLLINALKYTPCGGLIRIQSTSTKNKHIIKIQDTGIGLTIEEKPLIFKKFGKIEHYGKDWDVGIDGLGLGLYISKKIIEKHGGKIWFKSPGRNKGATFCFSLPINRT
ncbi:MAG: ATP-binding protein [archaeon]